ncbi:lytic polysaccharide monooxygenase [Streptomyces sp. NPDC005485]|uniref:lytic polysaccharide monooxygenase n=1 Tax=Streptomyces sp. NPDC005485 TaxID=3155591 RepID=UPI0033A6D15B
MTAHRRAGAAAAAMAAPLLLTTWAAVPAQAHGAPTDPVSRVFACSPDGGDRARTAACGAAIAANGAPFTDWDNLRVADVGGRDREVIPDGKLCSGGLPAYKGLDVARADYPATRLTPGAAFTLAYSSTIPHTGTFKLYLTKPGYDPTRPLTWSELPAKPFATATDPALVNGAYRIRAKLPSDRTGRQLLYTIWQNTSTTDTYYSCSDVVFPDAGKTNAGKTGAGTTGTGKTGSGTGGADSVARTNSPAPATSSAAPKPDTTTASAEAGAKAGAGAPAPPSDAPLPAADSTPDNSSRVSLVAGAAAAALIVTTGVAVTLGRRRSRRPR